ncbi:hypothetical protein ACS0TY_004966 [Phlomoides rotata]
MDSALRNPPNGSTITSSSISIPSSPPVLFLEVSLISAQDLAPVSKPTRTYAVAWINPKRKVATRTDHNYRNPIWNDKVTFRLDGQFLDSPMAAITVEIYTVSWFRHVLVGTVRVLLCDLLGSLQKNPKSTRFVALQIRRPSGVPQGILNMGVSLLNNSLKSMLLQHKTEDLHEKVNETTNKNQDDEDPELVKKIHLWRSMSVGSETNSPDQLPSKEGSMCNGSVANGSVVTGSELCSDIGPSASIVAADLAWKMHQPPPPPPMKHAYKNTQDDGTESSIVEEMTFEEAMAKGYRNRVTSRDSWKKAIYDFDESELSYATTTHSRRNSDGSLFSCFVGGVEFSIVCGASNKPPNSNRYNSMGRRKHKSSDFS